MWLLRTLVVIYRYLRAYFAKNGKRIARKLVFIGLRQSLVMFSLWAYYSRIDVRDLQTVTTTTAGDIVTTFVPALRRREDGEDDKPV